MRDTQAYACLRQVWQLLRRREAWVGPLSLLLTRKRLVVAVELDRSLGIIALECLKSHQLLVSVVVRVVGVDVVEHPESLDLTHHRRPVWRHAD